MPIGLARIRYVSPAQRLAGAVAGVTHKVGEAGAEFGDGQAGARQLPGEPLRLAQLARIGGNANQAEQ